MKFDLTIRDASASDVSRVLALFGGSASAIATTAATSTDTNSGDDDNGPVNTNAPATDSNGLPWDERIHSANKATTESGAWRKRRGVSSDLVASVEAELRTRAVTAATAQQQPQQPAPMQQAPQMPQQYQQPAPMQQAPQMPQQMPPQQYQQPAPMQQPQQMPPQQMPQQMPPQQYQQPAPMQQPQQMPQTAPAGGDRMLFHDFMQKFGPLVGNGTIDANYLVTVVQRVNAQFGKNYQQITDLATENNLDQIEFVVQTMRNEGRWYAAQ